MENFNTQNLAQIKTLFDKYMEILVFEMKMEIKATELRHLIGRLGEFHCALELKGSMALEVNQKGYDVVCNGKKISVKTTAQDNGFVIINESTLDKANELVFIKYDQHINKFEIIFHETVSEVKRIWHPYKHGEEIIQYELYSKRAELYTQLKKSNNGIMTDELIEQLKSKRKKSEKEKKAA